MERPQFEIGKRVRYCRDDGSGLFNAVGTIKRVKGDICSPWEFVCIVVFDQDPDSNEWVLWPSSLESIGSSVDSSQRDLYHKYNITKADGSPTDPNAAYFVLRIDTDPAARIAALTYADMIETDNLQFAEELRSWVATFQDEDELLPNNAEIMYQKGVEFAHRLAVALGMTPLEVSEVPASLRRRQSEESTDG